MRCAASSAAASVLGVLIGALAACGRHEPPPVDTVPARPTVPASVPHGDHNPHHGGVVMMKGEDLHYEVVLDPTGRAHQVFFSDAMREELPASIATDVSITLKRPSAADEHITLAIDDAGESWIGHGTPVSDPARTTARVAFAIHGEPYWIDLPFRQPLSGTSGTSGTTGTAGTSK
jgi:hypothetical protein